MKPNGRISLTWEEPDGSSTKITYKTKYLEAATVDVFNAIYRALGLTEFSWIGEPEQSDIDYLKEKYDLS